MRAEGTGGREGDGRRTPRITVVIPCLNEEHGLPRVLRAIPPEVFEILVLDNCSTDRTVDVATNGDPRVRVVRHEKNLGYGGSYLRGLPMVGGEVVVTSDGDGTYPIAHCLRLVDALIAGDFDFLSCSRFPLSERRNMSPRNRFGNRLLNLLVNGFYGLRLKDAQSGMWVFRTSLLDQIHLTTTGMAFSHEIKIEAFTNPGVKAGEISIPYAERIGTSKLYPVRDGIRMVRFLMRRRLFPPPPRPASVGIGDHRGLANLQTETRADEPFEVPRFTG